MKSGRFLAILYSVMSLLIAVVLVFNGIVLNGVRSELLTLKGQIASLDSEAALRKTDSAETAASRASETAATSTGASQTTAKTTVKAETTRATVTTAEPAVFTVPDVEFPSNPLTSAQFSALSTPLLTEEDYAALYKKSLSEIQASVHTIADAIALLDYINAPYYSGGIISFDPTMSVSEITENMNAALFNYLVFYFLSDDFPQMTLAHIILDNESILGVTAALLIPVENEYRVYSPSHHCKSKDNNRCLSTEIEETVASKDIKNLYTKIAGIDFYKNQEPIKIFLIRSPESKVSFLFDDSGFSAGTDNILLLYEKSGAKEPNEKNLQELEKKILNSTAVSALRSALTTDEIRALVGTDLDTVKEKIATIPDLMRFLALNNYRSLGHDMNIKDTTVPGVNVIDWHFNCEPYNCYAHNFGCCGTTSGLIAAILEGDYPEVGICGMSFVQGGGGGHVINYIYDGVQYIIWDGVNFVGNHYDLGAERFTTGQTLEEACNRWMDAVSDVFPEIEIFYCYESYEGDYPIGWNSTKNSYLPSIYEETTKIIRENREDGYNLLFVDVSEKMLNKIKEKRADYSEKCID